MVRPLRLFVRRRPRAALLAAAALSLVMAATVATAPPSMAERADRAGPSAAAGTPDATGVPSTITLITGDQVTIRTLRGGRVVVEKTVLAPRPGGAGIAFETFTDGPRTYVVPTDALRAFAAGTLDRQLFDVRYLAANGYADDKTGTLPVIVQYQRGLKQASRVLPATTAPVALPAVNGAAMRVTKAHASDFWQAIRGGAPATPGAAPAASALGSGLGRVWLDAKVKAADDVSNAQIGVPAAWAAGYTGTGVTVGIIDTGIDTTHPDLAGQVAAAQNFVPDGYPGGGDQSDVTDLYGHGSHVASIVAGTGAQSGGKYKGVAPGARLIIGKALDDTGSGLDSVIIQAMQWEAATEHARIVNMSLGSGPSDGTDPLSQAVDDLSAADGTLFVVAAGNSGPDAGTVDAPGAADAALTVAAVDKHDGLAPFSSRGPRVGDYAVKPDIAGTGVNIIAARAAGTSLGAGDGIPGDGPVDQYYTAASGTSMATPQVAGAAAILGQEHPGWSADQLKDALMSTSADDGFTVYQQGAGRVDVARAVSQQVDTSTADLSFGEFIAGQAAPVTKTIGYRNDSSKDVTLNLTGQLATVDGQAAPAGALTLSATSVTVPANGTAQVSVTVDPGKAPAGIYTGSVRAADTADGVQLATPVGYSELDQVHFHVKPPASADAFDYIWILTRVDKPAPVQFFSSDGWDSTQTLPPGTYSVATFVVWSDPNDGPQTALLLNPEFQVRDSTEVDLAASDAKKIAISAGSNPVERFSAEFGYNRAPAGFPQTCCTGVTSILWTTGYSQLSYWVTPTAPVHTGMFKYTSNWMLGKPLLSARVDGDPSLTLRPQYAFNDPSIPKLAGRGNVPVVFVHDGQPADFQGLDLHGAIALLHVPQGTSLDYGNYCGFGTPSALGSVASAAKAGAIAVLAYTDTGIPCTFPGPDINASSLAAGHSKFAIPTATLPADEGRTMAGLSSSHPVRLQYEGAPVTPDLYFLALDNENAVPASVSYSFRDSDLATVRTRFHASSPSVDLTSAYGFGPDDFSANIPWYYFTAPAVIDEHFGPLSPSLTWERFATGYNKADQWPATSLANAVGSFQDMETFASPTRSQQDWGSTPVVPGPHLVPDSVLAQGTPGPWVTTPFWSVCTGCRQGNDFTAAMFETGQSPLIGGQLAGFEPFLGGANDTHLYSGGQEIQPFSSAFIPVYKLPAAKAQYTLTNHFVWPDPVSGPVMQGAVDTSWTFSSAASDVNTEPQRNYVCVGTTASAGSGLDSGPCHAEPLIFLNYDLGLGLDNTLAGPGAHTFHITAYRQPDGQQQPAITKLTVSVSYDNGATWQPAQVRAGQDGQFVVTAVLPAKASGSVSLKTQAWDTAGDSVQQVISNAASLTAGA